MTTTVTISKPSTRRLTRLFLRPTLLIGGLIIILLVAIALLSLVWTPLPPTRMQIVYKLKPPLVHGLLGTDQLGRDLTSMLMVGAWNSLSTAMAAVVLGAGVGTLFGVTVAARRGMVEALTMRINDVIFAIPPILSAMMLGALLGTGRFTAIIAIAVFMVPVFARVTASAALQVWSRDYVLAARAAGKGQVLITIEHVLPNIASQIIVQVAIQLGLAILTEAGLSFLGLGMPPPAPTWGRMLADSQTYLAAAPWLAILPGLAIALTVLGFNMLGDGLRDLLDPREKGRS
ncbi:MULTISPECIES: ABC transporter permease [Rhizobium/Agrobacterium group]|uniref:ABC transporter n=2 Tax=Rhizobium/Agrobacterium group TaxID=227290 RepID=B9K1I4_ALLAM|nr:MULTISPECIES: ABC transporter permease [Rhizobium/Agrobacterium group]ACM38732.1 ABC transporter [Allorhizobium ampelinum S4]MCF1445900.1 ABC transporter permease [Allorhizobium ampelinum]MCF1491108.1 ABC transporter permease [Allorhizobium ampelinum]MUO26569.1 ABC transporter permease subunit [Agrobacterium vitis]MUO41682.1 ABC transporter permease subunit [Agrobacterium vitis]